MSERDRLAEIIKAEAKKYPPGYDLDEGCRHVADAILASEEWRAREAVMNAATQLDAAIYSLKREHELHADEIALHEALARVAAVRGETR